MVITMKNISKRIIVYLVILLMFLIALPPAQAAASELKAPFASDTLALHDSTSSAAAYTAPTAPENLDVGGGVTSVWLSWSRSTSSVGIAYYEVYMGSGWPDEDSADTYVGRTVNTRFLVAELSPTTDYIFVVYAVDTLGNRSAPSNMAYTFTYKPFADNECPSRPTDVSVDDLFRFGDESVTVTWSPSYDYFGINHYLIYLDGALRGSVLPGDNSYVIKGLDIGRTYTVTIVAVDNSDNSGNCSFESDYVQFTPHTEDPELMAQNLRAENITSDSFTLKWECESTGWPLLDFLVYVNGEKYDSVDAYEEVFELEITGLDPDTDYGIRVILRVGWGIGTYHSPIASISVRTRPGYVLSQAGLVIPGELTSASQTEEYQFVPSVSGVYTIFTTGDTDADGTLYNSNGSVKMEHDNKNAAYMYGIIDYNFRITDYLTAGQTYTLKIKSGGGGEVWDYGPREFSALGEYTLFMSYVDTSFPLSGWELAYTPSNWNNGDSNRYNCYNYALNAKISYGTTLQPGQIAQKELFIPTLYADPSKDRIIQDEENYHEYVVTDYENMINAFVEYCKADAEAAGGVFAEIGEYERVPNGCYKVALAFTPLHYYHNDDNIDDPSDWLHQWDYHWYRQNNDGTWSHKFGTSLVRDTDFSEQKIYHPGPDVSNTYTYSVFVGYFAVRNLSGFTPSSQSATPRTPGITPSFQQTKEQYSLNEFDFLESGMSESEVKTVLGEPNSCLGSGITRDVYHLDDGRKVVLDYGMYRDGLCQAYITDSAGSFGEYTNLLH